MQEIIYREDAEKSKAYKEAYLEGIRKLISLREKALVPVRNHYCKDIFIKQEQYREDFRKMLGWPLTLEKYPSLPDVKNEKLSDEEACQIYRISVEVFSGVSMTGLLFKKDNNKRPLVIAQHGGLGTPEVVGNIYGDTANYNHMVERILSYNANVFAPQLLIWDASYDVEYDRTALDAQLKRVGSSITAVEIFGLSRILDYFEKQDYVSNFGMVGLSYGGFYTLFLAAADTRIKAAISCSFFNDRGKYAWSDWTWYRSGETFSDAEIACLIYPRKLCIEVGTEDALFDINSAREEIHRLRDMSRVIGDEWIDIIEFDGIHEFCLDDEPIKKLAEELQ